MKQYDHRVLIVGAGLGGLCLANGLERSGFRVAVFERDDTPHARGQGYRLTIDPVGSKALRASLPTNLYELVVATSGVLGDRFTLYDHQRRILREISLPHAANADDTQVSKQIDRMTLRQILLAGLPGQVHFGKPFTRYERTGDLVTAFFADGSHETGDLLVGADGVNSRVARQLLPGAAVTDTGMRAIFGRTPLVMDGETRMPEDMIGSGVAVLGPGCSLFFTAMRFRERPDLASRRLAPGVDLAARKDYIMWAIIYPHPTNSLREHVAGGGELQKIAIDLSHGFHPDFSRIVAGADPNESIAIPIRSAAAVEPWATENVTLLGDAIHCMPPAGAHGANTALRDAATLARHLASALSADTPLHAAVSGYEAEMLPYAFEAVRDAVASMKVQATSGQRANGG